MIDILLVVYNKKIQDIDLDRFKLEETSIFVFDNSTDRAILENNKINSTKLKINYFCLDANKGLSFAYNYIIKNINNFDDYILFLDDDTSLNTEYINILKERIKKTNSLVFSPININKKTNKIDSPKKLKEKQGLLLSSNYEYKDGDSDFVMSINNGLLVCRKVFDVIGLYNENIFLYFVDSYLFFMLYRYGIKTEIVDYKNLCEFSFNKKDKQQMKMRFKGAKQDAYECYKDVYKKFNKPKIFFKFHYLVFCIRRAKECAKFTKRRYFLYYLFTKRGR